MIGSNTNSIICVIVLEDGGEAKLKVIIVEVAGKTERTVQIELLAANFSDTIVIMYPCVRVFNAQMQILRTIIDREPELELILYFKGIALLKVGSFLVVEGGSINSCGFDLGCKVFLVAEVIIEDPCVEAAKAGPRFGCNRSRFESWSYHGWCKNYNFIR
jgi:hypothetical protein